MKTTALLSLFVLIGFSVGCEVPEMEVVEKAPAPETSADNESAEEETAPEIDTKDGRYLPDGRVNMTGVDGEPPMTSGTPRPITARDPKKGKLSRRGGSALGTTVQALPWAESEVTFLTIKNNLNQYDAIKGHFPRSHKEFMEDFLPNYCPQLTLPKLEPGDAYLYDPEDHLLKIFRPGDPGAPQVEGVVAYEYEPEYGSDK